MLNWFKKENYKIGDLVAKNYGSFQKSPPYVITGITDGIYRCRLLKTKEMKKKLRMNKNYARKSMKFDSSKFGSFPVMLKLNNSFNDDTDEVRKRNLENTY